jgi:hypothetical protein
MVALARAQFGPSEKAETESGSAPIGAHKLSARAAQADEGCAAACGAAMKQAIRAKQATHEAAKTAAGVGGRI